MKNDNINKLVREAKVGDAKALTELYYQMCPEDDVNVSEERIKSFNESKRDFLLVAESNGVVAGTVTLNICLNAEMGLINYAIIENVIVSDKFRLMGIGKLLLDNAEKISREHNCEKIMLLSSVKRTGAHKFFKGSGFADDISKGFKKYLI